MSKRSTKERLMKMLQRLRFGLPEGCITIDDVIEKYGYSSEDEFADAAYDLGWDHAIECLMSKVEELEDF